MAHDFTSILIWWLFFFVLGVISFPTTYFFFKKFFDLGWGLSKTIGLLIVSYAAFLGAITKIVPLTQFTILLYLALFAGLNWFFFSKYKPEIVNEIKTHRRSIVLSEILFAFGLLFWAFVRAHQPDINGLEKFMDYGFVTSTLQSPYLPPSDMWAAGYTINYYWFGHYLTALIIKATGVASAVGYNLMLATILGLALASAFSIVSTLIRTSFTKVDRRVVVIGALLSAFLLSFGGNFHTPLYVLKNGADKYWYPDATRFIGYNPDTEDKTIHEFPQYSYVVADLHGHLLNFPFVLLFLATLFATISSNEMKTKGSKVKSQTSTFLRFLPLLLSKWNYYIALGFLLGIMFMTSTWDFGNYNIVSGITFGYLALQRKKVSLDAVFEAINPILKVFGLGLLFAIPFILNFESIAQGIDFVHAHTPLWQLGVLWGFPALLAFVFLGIAPIHKFFKLQKTDIFVLSLLTTACILIILPEIIYVKDIYIASHHRANTMFKLTYQAFVMSYLVSGYIIVRLMNGIKNQGMKFLAFICVLVVLSSLFIYPYFAIKSYYGDIFAKTNEYTLAPAYRGLDGETWMNTTHPEEYAVIKWLRQNTVGRPTILEAPGDSYTEFNVISSYTGLPTVSGWFVHEWLWRGKSEFPQQRADEVQQIYISPDPEYSRTLLKKYNVTYVIVGVMERQKYPDLDVSKWDKLGQKVFTSGSTAVYKVQ